MKSDLGHVLLRFTAILSAFFHLSGCCSARTQILPREKDYLIIGHSSSEACAFETCQKKATEYCSQRGRNFVLLKHGSTYQGMDQTAKGLVTGFGYATKTYIPTSSEEDYKVSMSFRCK